MTGPHKHIAPAGDWTPPCCSFETHKGANGHHLVCSSLTLPSCLEPQRGPGRPFSFKRQPLVGSIFVERPNPSQWSGDLWAKKTTTRSTAPIERPTGFVCLSASGDLVEAIGAAQAFQLHRPRKLTSGSRVPGGEVSRATFRGGVRTWSWTR